ncbi:MAG TPA: hypothetical protein VLT62_17285, partial [Candidatus Methylomirabilis sp.]|nr:hypothetical protein [Candidatus Methylomirabilis sp.]
MVPGAWKAARGAQDGREARSKDERAFVWVQMMTAQALESVEGASLVERVAAMITRMYEQNLGQTLTGVEVIPFESAGPATWKWKAATAGFMIGGQYYRIPARFIVDLSPHAVMHLTVDGTQDNDRVARGSSNPYERP